MNTLWILVLMYWYEGGIQVMELKYYPDPISCSAGKAMAEANMKGRTDFQGLYCLPDDKEET